MTTRNITAANALVAWINAQSWPVQPTRVRRVYSLDGDTKRLTGLEIRVTPGRWVSTDGQTRGTSPNDLELWVVVIAVLPPGHEDPDDIDPYEELAQQLSDDIQNENIGTGYVTQAARTQLHGRISLEANELYVAPILVTMRIWE